MKKPLGPRGLKILEEAHERFLDRPGPCRLELAPAQRLEGLNEVFSSPVGAAGRVYITDRTGVTLVLRNSPTFEVLAKNTLENGVDASPAIAGDSMYIRTYTHLYSIGS